MGCVRRNFVVSVPSFESCEALNAYIERRCLERMDARLRGLAETGGWSGTWRPSCRCR